MCIRPHDGSLLCLIALCGRGDQLTGVDVGFMQHYLAIPGSTWCINDLRTHAAACMLHTCMPGMWQIQEMKVLFSTSR